MVLKIISFIAGHEGYVSRWYLDPVGVPTIGHGFTWRSKVFRDWWLKKYGRKMRRGDTISREDAAIVLERLIQEEYAPPVEKAFAGLPDNVRQPGWSMIYNCGSGALSWRWAKALIARKIQTGCALWRETGTTASGKRLPGLVRRRDEEADIAEFNRYPAWLDEELGLEMPAPRVIDEDIVQAQTWLAELGYYRGELDGIAGPRTKQAVTKFQLAHGTLKVDGVIGPATLSALQRAIDLQSKAAKTTAGGAATTGSGAAVQTDALSAGVPGWVGDMLLWGGVIFVIAGLAWLGWSYRDELRAIFNKKG